MGRTLPLDRAELSDGLSGSTVGVARGWPTGWAVGRLELKSPWDLVMGWLKHAALRVSAAYRISFSEKCFSPSPWPKPRWVNGVVSELMEGTWAAISVLYSKEE